MVSHDQEYPAGTHVSLLVWYSSRKLYISCQSSTSLHGLKPWPTRICQSASVNPSVSSLLLSSKSTSTTPFSRGLWILFEKHFDMFSVGKLPPDAPTFGGFSRSFWIVLQEKGWLLVLDGKVVGKRDTSFTERLLSECLQKDCLQVIPRFCWMWYCIAKQWVICGLHETGTSCKLTQPYYIDNQGQLFIPFCFFHLELNDTILIINTRSLSQRMWGSKIVIITGHGLYKGNIGP